MSSFWITETGAIHRVKANEHPGTTAHRLGIRGANMSPGHINNKTGYSLCHEAIRFAGWCLLHKESHWFGLNFANGLPAFQIQNDAINQACARNGWPKPPWLGGAITARSFQDLLYPDNLEGWFTDTGKLIETEHIGHDSWLDLYKEGHGKAPANHRRWMKCGNGCIPSNNRNPTAKQTQTIFEYCERKGIDPTRYFETTKPDDSGWDLVTDEKKVQWVNASFAAWKAKPRSGD